MRNSKEKNYTIGLDIGTNSIGWAVIDDDFNLMQGKKKIKMPDGRTKRQKVNLWGVRLFDKGETAADRRGKRNARRRLTRRKERLNYLREIFEEEIVKFDESFFIRLDESFYHNDNREIKRQMKTIKRHGKRHNVMKYPLLNNINMTDQEYYDKYPTIYHLRNELVISTEKIDMRLVYLAMHHILKFRGHFVNQGQHFDLKNINIMGSLQDLLTKFKDASADFHFDFESDTQEEANQILTNRRISKSKKAFDLTELYSTKTDENFVKYEYIGTAKQIEKFLAEKDKQLKALFTAIAGNGIDLFKIFGNEDYKFADDNDFPKAGDFKYSNENFEEKLAEIECKLDPEEFDILVTGKKVYESIVLSNILTEETLAASMIEKYETHKKQLIELKQFTKKISRELFAKFFKENGVYTRFVEVETDKQKRKTNREDFYKEIKKAFETEFPGLKFPDQDKSFDFSKNNLKEEEKQFFTKINEEMHFETYLPKQRMSDNGAIPYQVHEYELIKIIENQKQYYPFLGEMIEIEEENENENGEMKRRKEYKIQTLMKFRIPYYVGPLIEATEGQEGKKVSDKSAFAWMQKKIGKQTENVTPWNFNDVVDKERSAIEFIERMTSFDTYLPNEKVLPKNSLLYQEFTIYNELMTCGWYGGKKRVYFSPELRQEIVEKLFKQHKKVSAQKMIDFLNNEHNLHIASPKILFGIDTIVKSPSYNATFSTYLDLKNAGISDEVINTHREIFEQIIKWQTIFEDRKILKKTIKQANKDEWSNLLTEEQMKKLSKKHYTGWGNLSEKLLDGIKASNGKTIIQNLKEENFNNFMRLLEDKKIAEEIKNAQVQNIDETTLNYDLVNELTGSPAIKKGIWQSLQIIKELENYLGRENISKIVVEVARENKTGRTKTREKQIEDYYNKFLEKTKDVIHDVGIYSEKDFHTIKSEFNRINDAKKFGDEKVFLYFLQNGKCMYSGADLDLNYLSKSEYEVDHIVPQTYIKDDGFDNKVLVLKKENQNKGGDVPSKRTIQNMRSYWELLAKNGQVSPRKLANLTMGKLTKERKQGFIKRQLVETRQITKHVANILSHYYKDNNTEILTPKASLTSQFRHGEVFVPIDEFDCNKAISDKTHFEYDNKEWIDGIAKESSYSNSNFVKVYFHEGFKKLRDLNDYHHAHDAYLNAVVATYIYETRPDLHEMWVYGEYQRKVKKQIGKDSSQRKDFFKQLLMDMQNDKWYKYYFDKETYQTLTTGEFWERDEVLEKIKKTLSYRNVNIVKKTEILTGKFGDETVYKKDEKAKNFADGKKKNLHPNDYGGTKKPTSACAVIARTRKGKIKPLSIPAMNAERYLNLVDKLSYLQQELYPKEKIEEIIVEKVPKYSKYVLPNGVSRLVASYQEAQNGKQLPMMKVADKHSSIDELLETYNQLSKFIQVNQLFAEPKLELLDTKIKTSFEAASVDEKLAIIAEVLRVTKASTQGLKALQKAGLGTTKQQLTTSADTISEGITIIYQSITGLYETKLKLEG